jgi:predicted negative regulator of RcsB-dependent stress response
MAESYLRIGMVEDALDYSSKSLLNDNTNAYAFKIKGECLLQMDEKEKACAEFTKAIQMGYSVTYDPEEIIKLVLKSCGFEG